jgi:hypothetical protein
MSILWVAGEDIDFPNGVAVVVQTTAALFRAGYARCAITVGTVLTFARSNNFPGGAITSGWFHFRLNATGVVNMLLFGLVKDSTSNSGLYIASSTASATRIALMTYNGTTKVQLAAETGNSISATGAPHRIDVQIVNYGVSATVNVYVDFVLLITFSGDVTVTGVTSLGAAALSAQTSNSQMSEIIVADEDTRPLIGVQTLALTGAGTVNNWTNNTFTNINGTTLSDVNPASSNTNDQVQSYNVTDQPAGTFVIKAVKISARLAKSATPAVAQVQLGFNNGAGSSAAGTGATKAVNTAYGTWEQLDLTNPITATDWAQADINALQLELTAKT